MPQAPDGPLGVSALAEGPAEVPAPSAPVPAPVPAPARPRHSYGGLWAARIELMRPGNGAMSALGVLVGLVVARQAALPLSTWVAAPLAAFLLAGFGNVLNDVRDARIDARAHPERPLPSGRLRKGDAQAWAAMLLLAGLFEAWLAAGIPTLVFALANALLLVLYEVAFKRRGLAGNVLVGALVASTFGFGAVASGAEPRTWGLLWLLMAMAGLANVAREVLKDIEDQDADRGERTTLPLEAGPGVARILAFALVNAAVVLSILAFLRPPSSWWTPWLAVLGAADLAFVVAGAWSWKDAGHAQRLLKAAMLLALLAFLAGPLVPLALSS